MAQFKIISGPNGGQVGAADPMLLSRNGLGPLAPLGRNLTLGDGTKLWVHRDNLSEVAA